MARVRFIIDPSLSDSEVLAFIEAIEVEESTVDGAPGGEAPNEKED